MLLLFCHFWLWPQSSGEWGDYLIRLQNIMLQGCEEHEAATL